MSYRLIDSNAIAIKYPEVNEMPCVFADLPDGINGQFIDVQPESSQVARDIATIVENEQDMRVILSQQWIPCSERLPEDIKPVIVTWENIDPKSYYQYIVGKRFIGTAHYKNGKWFWYSSVTEDLLSEYGRCDSEEFDEAIEVISWMPLPEPYKEVKDDNNRKS